MFLCPKSAKKCNKIQKNSTIVNENTHNPFKKSYNYAIFTLKGKKPMKNSFKCYIDSATAQKRLFDESVDNVKDSLTKFITESSYQGYEDLHLEKKPEPVYSTGWLKGALSYPWALVSVIIPSFLEDIF